MTPFPLHPLVEDEVLDAATYHDSHRPGYGLRFLDAVEVTLRDIGENPRRFARVETPDAPVFEIRRAGVPGFSYLILFRVEPSPLILARGHHRRSDEYWWTRIFDEEPGRS